MSRGTTQTKSKTIDYVNHPPHYTFGKFEVIDVIEDWKLDFHLAQVVKYVARAAHKGNFIEDLKKARFYLDRKILNETNKIELVSPKTGKRSGRH